MRDWNTKPSTVERLDITGVCMLWQGKEKVLIRALRIVSKCGVFPNNTQFYGE